MTNGLPTIAAYLSPFAFMTYWNRYLSIKWSDKVDTEFFLMTFIAQI